MPPFRDSVACREASGQDCGSLWTMDVEVQQSSLSHVPSLKKAHHRLHTAAILSRPLSHRGKNQINPPAHFRQAFLPQQHLVYWRSWTI